MHCTLLNIIAVCALYFALVQGQKEVEVHWHPFQLNPNAPKEGINKLGYYKAKFGLERTAHMIPTMTVRDCNAKRRWPVVNDLLPLFSSLMLG